MMQGFTENVLAAICLERWPQGVDANMARREEALAVHPWVLYGIMSALHPHGYHGFAIQPERMTIFGFELLEDVQADWWRFVPR